MNAHLKAAPRLKLLLELEPAHHVFFRNLADILLFRSPPPIATTSRPAPFWSDVFVYSGVPWWWLLGSMLWHVLAVVAVWSLSQGWALQEHLQQRRTFHQTYVSYYTPPQSFPALGSSRSRVGARPKEQRESASAHQPLIWVAQERTQSIITPPDIKLTEPGRPNIVASNPAPPAMPLSATGRSQLIVPAGPTLVVAPPPDVNPATARRLGVPQASVVAPPPDVEAVSGRRAITAPNASVVAPPPTVQGSIPKVGNINIGHSEVVEPSPRLPMHEQRAISGIAQATLGSPATSVVPPPPSVKRSGTLVDGRVSSLSSAGLHVVPPSPSVEDAGNSTGGARVSSLSSAGLHVVPPPPSVEDAGNSAGGGRASSLSSAGLQVVPPPPSVEDAGNSTGGARVSSLSSAGLHVVPSAPSVQDVGNSTGGGRVGSLSSAGLHVVPPAPSVEDADNSAGGGHLTAMDIPPAVAPPPPPVIDNPRGPATQELPVRVIGLALALPSSSYFSNYEVFIAERQLSKDESQLIKLVYVSLPYQRRLSEYGLNNSRVYKLRVTRDPTCDETLLQMTWPETDPRPGSQYSTDSPALSPSDRNGMLPCYRTTADDYRRALSHSRPSAR